MVFARRHSTSQPNVNAQASTPGSRNSISNTRSMRLADQLVQTLDRCHADPLLVDVCPMAALGVHRPAEPGRGLRAFPSAAP